MQYGLDMVYPPTIEHAATMRSLGWSFCGVYVGGPRAIAKTEWHQVDGSRYPVRDLAAVFDGFVPIYVGRNVGDNPRTPWDSQHFFTYSQGQKDGDEANELTGACGFGPTSPLALDVEYGTYQAHPGATLQYVLGFVDRVNAAGHPVILYSDPVTIAALGHPEVVDFTWCAQWLGSVRGTQYAPEGRFDPRIPPPWDMWQFGSSIIAGVSVDLNSCADDVVLARYG